MSKTKSKAAETDGISPIEYMITAISGMLDGLAHVAVGARSPIPGSAAHLAKARSGRRLRVSILGSRKHSSFTDGARELFDCAGQGRIDAFFLSGGQIDGKANINLVGIGDIAAYPRAEVRFPGSFGSAYLYYVVPRVILFHQEHSPRVLVDKVDFISAPGTSPPDVFRPGGPYALVTPLCVFRFDRTRARFTLASTHPGVSVADVRAATGFDYDEPDSVPVTPAPSAADLALLRGEVARAVADTYPAFAAKAWGIGRA
ncbi:MAG: CoA synthetase [Hyphomicrobiaceae bacterium]|nr:MAG: CoA synthetase [Hyphomicrobiaceae bacterium]